MDPLGEPAPGVEVQEGAVLQNRGVDVLTLDDVSLDVSCPPEFTLVSAPAPGSTLAQFETAPVELSFVGSSTEPRACVVWISSDDPEAPRAGLHLAAFAPTDGSSADDADGDGYAEWDNDCDDTNPAVHPGAPELCNGHDDDCDGLRQEDGCLEFESRPVVTGGLAVAPDACEAGDTAQFGMLVAHRDGGDLEFRAPDESIEVSTDALDGATRFAWSLVCPEPGGDNPGVVLESYLVVTGADGEDWAEARLTSWAEPPPWVDHTCADE